MTSKIAIGLLRIADLASVLVAGWLAFAIIVAEPEAAWSPYGLVALLGAVLLVNMLQIVGAYVPERVRQPLADPIDLMGCVALTGGILIAIAFLTRTTDVVGRGWAIIWLLGTFTGLIAARAALHALLRQLQPTSGSGWLRRNIAIVGGPAEASRLIATLKNALEPHVHILGVYDDQLSTWRPEDLAVLPAAGRITDLCALSRRLELDKIYVAMPWSAPEALFAVLRQLACLPVDVRLQLPPIGDHLLDRRVSHLHGMPFVHVADRPLGEWGRLLKSLEDHLVALFALLLFAPLLVLIALAIKIESPGPVLFRQRRFGFNNGMIEVLKFRTMRHELADPTASRLTARDDPRVTAVGRVLRRTSLDELPQLWNVLRGEMSIVGPRPHPLEAKAADRFYPDIVVGYMARHKVKPGITGWAQVNGWRGSTDTEEQLRRRVEHDLDYVERWSLGFDIKIILMTIYRGFLDENAY